MADFYGATSLTGGGAGALDAIDGADLSDGDGAVVIKDGMHHVYHLDASSGATEAVPKVIAPDNNPGTKRWVLANGTQARLSLGADQAIATATWTKVDFSVADYDERGEHVPASDRLVLDEAGYYRLTWALVLDAIGSTKGGQVQVHINSAAYAGGDNKTGNDTFTYDKWNGSIEAFFAAGTTIELYFYHDYGSNRNLKISADGGCKYCISRIG